MSKKPTKKIIATNKKARFNYTILERVEAGIQLTGSEVKAIRSGRLNLAGGYVKFKNNEAFVVGMYISQFGNTDPGSGDPTRTRKLLLKKAEIRRLQAKNSQKGVSVIPLSLYLKYNLIKLEIGVGKGKRKGDKRAVLKKRDDKRKMERETAENLLDI